MKEAWAAPRRSLPTGSRTWWTLALIGAFPVGFSILLDGVGAAPRRAFGFVGVVAAGSVLAVGIHLLDRDDALDNGGILAYLAAAWILLSVLVVAATTPLIVGDAAVWTPPASLEPVGRTRGSLLATGFAGLAASAVWPWMPLWARAAAAASPVLLLLDVGVETVAPEAGLDLFERGLNALAFAIVWTLAKRPILDRLEARRAGSDA